MVMVLVTQQKDGNKVALKLILLTRHWLCALVNSVTGHWTKWLASGRLCDGPLVGFKGAFSVVKWKISGI